MDQLFALSVVVPLLAAAAILAVRPLLGTNRRVLDLVAVLVSAAVAVMLLFLLVRTKGGDSVYWFGGFRPVHGVAIGIDFEAGLAQRRTGVRWRGADDRLAGVLLAVLRTGRCLLSRPDAHVPGGHDGVLPHRRHLRHVRLVRADGCVRVRADRLPARRTRPDPGGAELRHHQQRGCLPVADRDRDDLRPQRRAQHGPDRPVRQQPSGAAVQPPTPRTPAASSSSPSS